MDEISTRGLSHSESIMDRVTTLDDVFDPIDLAQAIDGGYVRTQRHPELDLGIYNYTERAVHTKTWTPVTKACRGLIADNTTGEVLARPFAKFWNTTEHTDAELAALAAEPVEVWEKVDGSLAVLYSVPGAADSHPYAIATRGSFTSVQAQHATEVLRKRYPDYVPPAGVTVLFEIIYPENRIVVDYAGLDDLVLLGGVDIATGRSVPFAELRAGWPGPAVKRYPYSSLAEALAAPELPNLEGYVIRFVDSDVRVKAKFADYVRLHRLLTGITVRTVWEYCGIANLAAAGIDARRIAQTLQMPTEEVEGILAATPGGDWMAPFLDQVPEEFEAWIKATATEVNDRVDVWQSEQLAAYAGLGINGASRADAAATITKLPKQQQGAMFSLFDQRNIRPLGWKQTRPAHEMPFSNDPNAEPG